MDDLLRRLEQHRGCVGGRDCIDYPSGLDVVRVQIDRQVRRLFDCAIFALVVLCHLLDDTLVRFERIQG